MEFGINSKKKRVVWLCHLNNEYVSSSIGAKQSMEFAPWIDRFADIFEKYNEYDIYIVSPHSGVFTTKTFSRNNIHYIFFPFLIPGLPKRVFTFLHRITKYCWNKYKIKRLIGRIDPDLIHLFGTENIYFTSSIFQFKNIKPIFITIQGFASHTYGTSKSALENKANELRILKEFNNYGVRDEEMIKFITEVNPNAKFYHHEIAPYRPKYYKLSDKDSIYDIIFFGRVCKEKGIEDLIKALSIVKRDISNVTAAVVGPISVDYLLEIKMLTKYYDVEENISFLGVKDSIDDVHKIAIQSKICVLPTYADTIPGTILESMLMGIPCITYNTGGIPSMKTEGVIKIVNVGNVEMLISEIINMLSNPTERMIQSKKASKYVNTRWSDDKIYSDIVNVYKKIQYETIL